MKNLIVITLLCFGLFSCSGDGEKAKETATKVENNDEHAGHGHAGHDHTSQNDSGTVHIKASPESPYYGVWSYVASTYKPDFYKNRWIEFFPDMTFENGIGGKVTNRGKWALDLETNIIDLDYEDNSAGKEPDEQWKTRNNSPVLLMLGNTPKNPGGGQIKLKKLDTRPAE